MSASPSMFQYVDYKEVLRDWIARNDSVYGYKSQLAEAAGCQKSFLSQVLNTHIHFTPEHALSIAQFWRLSPMERDFFLDLVHLARAGTEEMRRYYRSRIQEAKAQSENLSTRFQNKETVPDEGAVKYYSSWQYSAVHILLTIPEFQSVKAIARRLEMSEAFVRKTLGTLAELDLAKKQGEKWQATNKSIHLPRSSPLNGRNHHNWRQKAVEKAMFNEGAGNVHYTAVYSLSVRDAEALKDMAFQFIDHTRSVVIPSQEEEMVCMNLDLFRV